MKKEMNDKKDSIKKDIKKEDSIKKEEENKERRRKKVKVGFFLDEELVEEFRRFVVLKHGKYEKGIFSYEMELALKHWMSLHTKTQNSKNFDIKVPSLSKNPPSKVRLVYAMVKEFLWIQHCIDFTEVNIVPIQFVERAIKVIRGTDPRTVKKWINAMKEFGLIKVRGKLVEFVA